MEKRRERDFRIFGGLPRSASRRGIILVATTSFVSSHSSSSSCLMSTIPSLFFAEKFLRLSFPSSWQQDRKRRKALSQERRRRGDLVSKQDIYYNERLPSLVRCPFPGKRSLIPLLQGGRGGKGREGEEGNRREGGVSLSLSPLPHFIAFQKATLHLARFMRGGGRRISLASLPSPPGHTLKNAPDAKCGRVRLRTPPLS